MSGWPYEEKIAAQRERIQQASQSAQAHHTLGKLPSAAGRYEEAVPAFREAYRLEPSGYHLWSLLCALDDAGQLEERAILARQVVRQSPDDPKAHQFAIAALRGAGYYEEALAHCRELIRLLPDRSTGYWHLYIVSEEAGYIDDAITACREALQRNPTWLQGYLSLAAILKSAGRKGEAIAILRSASRVVGDDPLAHRLWGEDLYRFGLRDEARAAWARALVLEGTEPTEEAIDALAAFYGGYGTVSGDN